MEESFVSQFVSLSHNDRNGSQEQDRFVNSTTITETIGNFCLLSPDKQVDYFTRGESKKLRSRSLTETTPITNKNVNL